MLMGSEPWKGEANILAAGPGPWNARSMARWRGSDCRGNEKPWSGANQPVAMPQFNKSKDTKPVLVSFRSPEIPLMTSQIPLEGPARD